MSERSQWKMLHLLYGLNDLDAGKAMLRAELAQWASVNHAQGVKALYDK